MPTGTLVLVSWSGFTGPALTKIEQQGGRVIGLTPEPIGAGAPVLPQLSYRELKRSSGQRAALTLRNDDDSLTLPTPVPLSTVLYSAPNVSAERSLGDLVERIINGNDGEMVMRKLDEYEQNRDLIRFMAVEIGDLDDLGMYVYSTKEGRYQLISGLAVLGEVSVSEQPVEFTPMRLGDTVFATGRLKMAERDAIWVLTHDGEDTATVSWRLLD